MHRLTLIISLGLLLSLGAGGCAQSRYDQVKDASRQVQVVLDSQLKAALSEEPPVSEPTARRDRAASQAAYRQAQINRLTSIKYQLSAANVALGAVPYLLEQPAERETAYTFLEEVYSTLAWNAKLPPDVPLRALPANPMPGKLNFAPTATSDEH